MIIWPWSFQGSNTLGSSLRTSVGEPEPGAFLEGAGAGAGKKYREPEPVTPLKTAPASEPDPQR